MTAQENEKKNRVLSFIFSYFVLFFSKEGARAPFPLPEDS